MDASSILASSTNYNDYIKKYNVICFDDILLIFKGEKNMEKSSENNFSNIPRDNIKRIRDELHYVQAALTNAAQNSKKIKDINDIFTLMYNEIDEYLNKN